MNNDLIDFYEAQKSHTEKEIEELREVDKKSKAKEIRVFELGLILEGLTAEKENKRLRDRIRDLELRLKLEGIEINE